MISVIIPTYGEPVFLKKAILSVLNQTYHDFELIIVDDNDPESNNRVLTKAIIEELSDNRIIYLCHPKNLNGATARNTGLKGARGQYIPLLDSHDEYSPQRLES